MHRSFTTELHFIAHHPQPPANATHAHSSLKVPYGWRSRSRSCSFSNIHIHALFLFVSHTHTPSLFPLSLSCCLFLIRSLIFFFSLPHFGITGGRVGRFFSALCSILSAQSACVNPWANLSLNAKCDFKKWNRAGKYHCHNTLFWDLASIVIYFENILKRFF